MDNKEQKQEILRERILNQSYDVLIFMDFMKAHKGTNLDDYTIEEILQITDKFCEQRRATKQEYLRQEIINKNYDVEKFVEYMQEQKINGANIDNWSMEELQDAALQFQNKNQIVQQERLETQEEQSERIHKMENFLTRSTMKVHNKDFGEIDQSVNMDEDDSVQQQMRKSMWTVFKNPQKFLSDSNSNSNVSGENKNSQKDSQKEEHKIEEQFKNIQIKNDPKLQQDQINEKESQQFLENQRQKMIEKQSPKKPQFFEINNYNYKIMQQYFYKQFPCKTQESKVPFQSKLKISIPRWERISGGLFGWTDKYVMYEIQTSPFNWSVKRRMNDFIQLRKILVKFFPGLHIPPLDTNTSEYDDKEIEQRIQFLSMFANHLKYTDILWSNQFTQAFFSDQNQWEMTVLNAKSKEDPDKPICSSDGNLQIRLSRENLVYKQEVQQFSQKAEGLFNELTILSQKLQEDFEKLSNQLNKITQVQQNLVMSITNFNIQLAQKLPNSEELNTIVSNNEFLQKTYKDMSGIIQSWSKSTKQQGKLVENMQNMFRYNKLSLQNTKDLIKGYDDAEYSYINFKQNLEKQSKHNPAIYNNPSMIGEEVRLEEQYGYWSQSINTELQDLLNTQADDYIAFFNYLSRFETIRINEILKSWSKSMDGYFQNQFFQIKPLNEAKESKYKN